MSAIRLEGLIRRYGRTTALDGIDLEIAPDRLTVFCGPPGSGKSVLFRLLVGLEKPDAGHILLDGTDITTLPGDRRSIGYVPQSFALFPHMTVFDNIAYPMARQGVARAEIAQRVDRAAAVLRITPLLHKQPSQLSGGEKQRAAIARGILKNARIFILDDPLVGLDFKLRESLMEDLTEMRAELGATFLYATSDPLEALMMAEDLVVMDAGRIVDAGAADRVYHRPARLRAAELVGFPRCNVLNGRVDGAVCDTGLCRIPVAATPGEVMVVIRAEAIAFAEGSAQAGEIRLLENLGAESVVHFGFGGETLVTTAPSRRVMHLDIGDPFPFVLNPEGILLYTGDTGALAGHGLAERVLGHSHA
jgi:ABC-type sugar transport system ATPase subunit